MPRYRKTLEDKDFFALLPGAFVYPLRGSAPFLLLLGAAFFWVFGFATWVPFFGILLALFLWGYLAAFMFRIIETSCKGETDLPDWPGLTDIWDDIFRPLFLVLGSVAFSFLPVAALAFVHFLTRLSVPLWAWITVSAACVLYLPMALLGVALLGTAEGLSPTVVIPSIARVPQEYLAACAVLALMVMLETIIRGVFPYIPFVTSLASGFVGLYFMAAEMRILGLLYFTNEHRLRWFG